jgi:aspartyl-tRNA(Asn)/glutamyl-tRNA(Gln) amidotransferase subunit A
MALHVGWYTLASFKETIKKGEKTAEEIHKDYIQRARSNPNNSYITVNEDNGIKNSNAILWWASLAIKDNMLIQWWRTTCASRMLKDYMAPYTATCVERLMNAGAAIVWKTNLDEFAMWSSNESSYFGPVWHPLDDAYVPWGSSGGSAVAVALDTCIASLGTDTGWSVRLPASLCGVVWYKPSYGMISRYGVVAMASSLDQVWTCTKNVDDAITLTSIMAWYDHHDATTQEGKNNTIHANDTYTTNSYDRIPEFNKLRIALPREFFWEWLDEDVRESILDLVSWLRAQGAIVDEIDFPLMQYGVPVYYILMPAEVTTNLARFDGIRFGINPQRNKSWDWPHSIQELYSAVRNQWFGQEVQRRIMIGNYVLSSGYYDAFYRKAQAVRTRIADEFIRIFGRYDLVLWPTSPTVARRRGEKSHDPLRMYMMDIYTVLANLAGLPAISLPIKPVERWWKKRPVGAQLMAARFDDHRLLSTSRSLERYYS